MTPRGESCARAAASRWSCRSRRITAASSRAGVLRLSGDPGTFDLPATFEGSLGRLVVNGSPGGGLAGGTIPRGRYELTAHVGGAEAPGLPAGTVVVRDDGRFVDPGRARRVAPRPDPLLGRVVRAGGHRDRAVAVRWPAFRRMPQWAKDPIRSAYGRLRG